MCNAHTHIRMCLHTHTHTHTHTPTHTHTYAHTRPHTHRCRLVQVKRSKEQTCDLTHLLVYTSHSHVWCDLYIIYLDVYHLHVQNRCRLQQVVGCLKLQVSFRKRATNYSALLRKMTWKDKASYDSKTGVDFSKSNGRINTCVP